MIVAGSEGGGGVRLKRRLGFGLALLALDLLLSSYPGVGHTQAAGERQGSTPARLVTRSLLLDGANTGALTVVVGERGHVLVSDTSVSGSGRASSGNHSSDDAGEQWTQVQVPTRSTLCAVVAVDPEHIWAAGHDAIILHSRDRGRTWSVQHQAPEAEAPLFALWFEDGNHGIALGAYGLFLETHDGGATWNQRTIGETDAHLYSITETATGELFIAGESGTILRSRDRGGTWEQLDSPYGGSFFGILALRHGALLVFGLRGNVFRSETLGDSWQKVDLQSYATLMGGDQSADDDVVLVGLSGAVFVSDGSGLIFHDRSRKDRVGLSAALFLENERLLLLGDSGVLWFDGSGSSASATRETDLE